jgi:hypothetical protein
MRVYLNEDHMSSAKEFMFAIMRCMLGPAQLRTMAFI